MIARRSGFALRHPRSVRASDLGGATLEETLPDACLYKVCAKTGWSGVSTLGDTASSIGNFYLSDGSTYHNLCRSAPDIHCACCLAFSDQGPV